ncbi:MAG: hypothetical protein WCG26_09940 [Chloroflexales bacterium]
MDTLARAVGMLAAALRTTANEVRTPIPAAIPTTFLTQFAACLDAAAAALELVLVVMAHGHEREVTP